MKKLIKFWKIIVLDTLGVLCMIGAIATGWLPGPGGIPLFIIGLSLFAINHEWAERYIDLIKDYADRLGDLVFVSKPWVQWTYDLLAPIAIFGGGYLLWQRNAIWQTGVGTFLFFMGITFLLGNRRRWPRLKRYFKRKR